MRRLSGPYLTSNSNIPKMQCVIFNKHNKIILNQQPTEHLADVGLDVYVLEVVESVGVVEAERGVQPDGDPHPVTHPGHLPHLGLLPATRDQLEMLCVK